EPALSPEDEIDGPHAALGELEELDEAMRCRPRHDATRYHDPRAWRILAAVSRARSWEAIMALWAGDLPALARPGSSAESAADRLARACAAALLGRADEAQRDAREVQTEALAARSPELVCDAVSIRALAAANAGDLGAATDLARRASMMSRTETLL